MTLSVSKSFQMGEALFPRSKNASQTNPEALLAVADVRIHSVFSKSLNETSHRADNRHRSCILATLGNARVL